MNNKIKMNTSERVRLLSMTHLFCCPHHHSTLPTAVHSNSDGGERQGLHGADPLHRAEAVRGARAHRRAGEERRPPRRGGAGQAGEGDQRAAEERRRAGEALEHRGSRPIPTGEFSSYSSPSSAGQPHDSNSTIKSPEATQWPVCEDYTILYCDLN